MADVSIEEFKADLRRIALAMRVALPADARAAAAQAVAARPFPVPITPGMVVSAYAPMKSEFNPAPLMRKLADAGAQLALPVVMGRGKPLMMRAWSFGEPLTKGVWGIREPTANAPEVWPDVLIVPLAAFDRKGHRIGYGAGYFDMTLNRLRMIKQIVAVGIGFAVQHVAVVPITPRDARLDLVLTEREVIECRRK